MKTTKKHNSPRKVDDLFVIGIGASAGGLEAIQEFLTHFPKNLYNTTIIIAQHLSPSYKSMLVQLLGRSTDRKVTEIKDGMPLEPNYVYETSEKLIDNNEEFK